MSNGKFKGGSDVGKLGRGGGKDYRKRGEATPTRGATTDADDAKDLPDEPEKDEKK